MEVPIWVRAGLSLAAAAELLGCDPVKPREVSLTPTAVVAVSTTINLEPAVLSEKRKQGVLLENVAEAKPTDWSLSFRESVSINNLTITSMSERYGIKVDLNALNYWMNECNVRILTPNVAATLSNSLASGQTTQLFSNAGGVAIILGLDHFYEQLTPDLDAKYEIDSNKRALALRNFVNIRANLRFIDTMCGGAEVSSLIKLGVPDQVTNDTLNRSTARVNSYEDDFLTGVKPLIFRVELLLPASPGQSF